MLVSIIVLNYKSSNDTIRLVHEISNLDKSNLYSFVIVDNSCSEHEALALESAFRNFSNLIIIYNESNIGYSSGNNIGLKYASKMGSKYFLIINPDIEILTINFIGAFIEIMESFSANNTAFIGPKVFNPYYGIYQSPLRKPSAFIDLFSSKSALYDKSDFVYSIVGCCIFGKLDLFEKLGYFDEQFFLYYEEYVLAEKAAKADYLIYYSTSIKINHLHKIEFKGFFRELKRKIYQANSYIRFFKNYQNFGIIKVTILYTIFCLRSFGLVSAKFIHSLLFNK